MGLSGSLSGGGIYFPRYHLLIIDNRFFIFGAIIYELDPFWQPALRGCLRGVQPLFFLKGRWAGKDNLEICYNSEDEKLHKNHRLYPDYRRHRWPVAERVPLGTLLHPYYHLRRSKLCGAGQPGFCPLRYER